MGYDYRMVRQKGGMFEFEPYMISEFQTSELIAYINPDSILMDDEISIKGFEYRGHDHSFGVDRMHGGNHTDNIKKDYTMTEPGTIKDYFKKFHKNPGNPSDDDELAGGKIGGRPHSDCSRMSSPLDTLVEAAKMGMIGDLRFVNEKGERFKFNKEDDKGEKKE